MRVKLTRILRVDVPLPRNRRVDERAWGVRVDKYRKVDSNFGTAPTSDVGRQGSRQMSIHRSVHPSSRGVDRKELSQNLREARVRIGNLLRQEQTMTRNGANWIRMGVGKSSRDPEAGVGSDSQGDLVPLQVFLSERTSLKQGSGAVASKIRISSDL